MSKLNVFRNILCVASVGDQADPVLERAVALAERNQAKLTVVQAIDKAPPGYDGTTVYLDRLKLLVEPYVERIDVTSKVIVGTPFMMIIRDVLNNDRDLVIRSTHSREWQKRLFGSNDMQLLRNCPCPVWLVKTERKQHRQPRILAAIDVDDNYPRDQLRVRLCLNRDILKLASYVATSESAELHVVHAWRAHAEAMMRGRWHNTPEDEIIDYVESLRSRHENATSRILHEVFRELDNAGVERANPRTHLRKGSARAEVPALAREIDASLLVMGTVGRVGIPGYLVGNSAETILSEIDCSVLAIKPRGFESPIAPDH